MRITIIRITKDENNSNNTKSQIQGLSVYLHRFGDISCGIKCAGAHVKFRSRASFGKSTHVSPSASVIVGLDR
jgi:hypothetical protein